MKKVLSMIIVLVSIITLSGCAADSVVQEDQVAIRKFESGNAVRLAHNIDTYEETTEHELLVEVPITNTEADTIEDLTEDNNTDVLETPGDVGSSIDETNEDIDETVDETVDEIETVSNTEIDSDIKLLTFDIRYLDTSYYGQDNYPVGCELVSAQMLFAYNEIQITVDDMVKHNYINLASFEDKDGKRYGGNPNREFVGDPKDIHSYGCYVGAIKSLFNSFISTNNLTDYKVIDLSGNSLSDLCEQYVKYGIPVMIWASMDMKPLKDGDKWIDKVSGEEIVWKAGEHCLLLVGYDNTGYYFNDPMKGKAVHYDYNQVDEIYDALGKQAITFIEKEYIDKIPKND